MFTSDLYWLVETAEVAFGCSGLPVLADWRLRECDYGQLNGAPAAHVHAERRRHLVSPYPDGESWEQAIASVRWFLCDLAGRWAGRRVLVIGHVATRWGFDHLINGVELTDLIEADFAWREGWEYQLDHTRWQRRQP